MMEKRRKVSSSVRKWAILGAIGGAISGIMLAVLVGASEDERWLEMLSVALCTIPTGAFIGAIGLATFALLHWVAAYGKPTRKESGYLIPIVVALDTTAAVVVAFLFWSPFVVVGLVALIALAVLIG